MKRDDLYDLAAFAVVAEQRSFTRAAAELGISQSALSHAVKELEERLGVRLLSRTTRSVSTTEAGETLLRHLRPALADIASSVDALGALRGKPSGTLRITATKHAVSSVVMRVLPRFLASHPDIRVEMLVDDTMTDIVANRIDAGIRFGDLVEKDMIAIRIGPDIRMAVVGAPSYFADHPVPRTPRELSGQRCINYRQLRSGGLYAWDFEEKGRPFTVRVAKASRTSTRMRWRLISRPGGSRGSCRSGARLFPATISITPAGGRLPRHWLRSLERFATNPDQRSRQVIWRRAPALLRPRRARLGVYELPVPTPPRETHLDAAL
jgi:DNA-binding transcriptional LysR family regulator